MPAVYDSRDAAHVAKGRPVLDLVVVDQKCGRLLALLLQHRSNI
jgi:hypothetical protein